MNEEKIKELANQCYQYSNMTLGIVFDKEKFARLIISECIHAVEFGMDYQSGKSPDFDAGELEGLRWARDAIKETFGFNPNEIV